MDEVYGMIREVECMMIMLHMKRISYLVIFGEGDIGGREMATTDEDRLLRVS